VGPICQSLKIFSLPQRLLSPHPLLLSSSGLLLLSGRDTHYPRPEPRCPFPFDLQARWRTEDAARRGKAALPAGEAASSGVARGRAAKRPSSRSRRVTVGELRPGVDRRPALQASRAPCAGKGGGVRGAVELKGHNSGRDWGATGRRSSEEDVDIGFWCRFEAGMRRFGLGWRRP
jgi:hypothetical protein